MGLKHLIPRTRLQYGVYLFFLLVCAYAVDYSSRGALSTSIIAIAKDTGYTKSELGAVGMGFFLMYGTIQLIIGPIADKAKPHFFVAGGLFLSGIFTFLTGISHNITSMAIFWALNGLAQSIIWPPVIKIISEWMPLAQRAKSALWISAANPVGAILLYITSAVVFSMTGWRGLFYVFSIMLVSMAVFSFIQLSRVKKILDDTAFEDGLEQDFSSDDGEKTTPQNVNMRYLIFETGIYLVCCLGILMGFLREGIVAWAPTFLVEQYHLQNVHAVLLTSVLPIVNLSGAYAAAVMLKKTKQNETLTFCILFLVAVASIACLMLLSGGSPVGGILFLAITTASQLGTGSIITMIPIYFAPFHKSATIMGIINFCVFLGTALASYLFGAIAENYGWNVTMISWIIVAGAGAAISLLLTKRWKRFKLSLPEQSK